MQADWRDEVVFLLAAAITANEFALKDGDRVLFYGDSITEHQRYSAYVEAYVRTRFPQMKISFMGAGWAGDTAKGGNIYWDESGGAIEERVAKDVAPRNATHITVMLGMNDAYYSPFNPEWLGWFLNDYRQMLSLMQKATPKAKFTLLSPSPWDDFTRPPSFTAGVKGEGGYNATLVKYGEAIDVEAKARGFAFIDVNKGMREAMTRAAKADPENATKLISDWIHPDWTGALVMAAVMLEGWNAPKDISHVTIDLEKGTASGSSAKIKAITDYSWMQQEFSLPFPYDPTDTVSALAADSVDLANKLDDQSVTVKGLAPGLWRLRIAGKTVLDASADDFAKGVSLSRIKTPMREKSLEIMRLVRLKNRLQHARWRDVERPTSSGFERSAPALKAMIKLEDEAVEKMKAVAKPQWMEWSLSPVPGKLP